MVEKIKKIWKNWLKKFDGYTKINYIIYIFCLIFLIWLLMTINKGTLIFGIIPAIILIIYIKYKNTQFLKHCEGNGIIFGARGSGKGLLLQKKINTEKKAFTNVPYGKNTELINIKEYFQSIGDNTIVDTINGTVKICEKDEKLEGINVYWDDITIYAPNFMDHELKKIYPSAPLTLAINRHLYNAYMIIAVQSRERPWKIIRELQTDFSIKALKTIGFGKIWNSIPILRNYVKVSYRYYAEVKSADNGILPFKAKTMITEVSKGVYLTSGQAQKEVFNAEHGLIFNGFIFMKKSQLYYDTRYFHQLFFGHPASKKEKKKKKKTRKWKKQRNNEKL